LHIISEVKKPDAEHRMFFTHTSFFFPRFFLCGAKKKARTHAATKGTGVPKKRELRPSFPQSSAFDLAFGQRRILFLEAALTATPS
jgi:hypothetical protein